MAHDRGQLMELVQKATNLAEIKRIFEMLKSLRSDEGIEKGDLSTLDDSIREVEVIILKKEATEKMNVIYDTGYFASPYLDDDIRDRLENHGGGWAGKIPNGDGYVLIHVVEAELDLNRTILRAIRRNASLRYRIREQKVEPVGNDRGFVCRVHFINRSNAPFSYDWSQYGLNPKFRFRSSVDGKYWVSGYPSGHGAEKALASVSHLFDKVLTLGPGQTAERVFLFRGGTKYDPPTFSSDMVSGEYTIDYEFPKGCLAPFEKRRRLPRVSFPLFKIEGSRTDGLARVVFEIYNIPTKLDRFRDTENYFVVPMSMIVSTKDKERFLLDKYSLIPLSVDKDVIFKVRVEATAEKPGVNANVGTNTDWTISGAPYEWPTVHPSKVIVVNPDPASGGRDPPEVPPVVFEEPKEGEKAVVVKEEDMADPVATYSQWLLTHEDHNYRRFSALRLGELKDDRALEALILGKKDKDLDVALAAGNSFKKITGLGINAWLRKRKQDKEEREKFRQIALRDARVVNVSIKDSVIQRSSIMVGDADASSVDIKDSVVVHSGIGEGSGTMVDDVRVGKGDRKVGKGSEDNTEKYEKALTQALADGVITPVEERLLDKLRNRFGISRDEHDILLAILRDKGTH